MCELSQFYVRLHNHIRLGRNDEAISMLNQEPTQSSTNLGVLLHHAAIWRNNVIVRELIRLGVKVDRVRLSGRTALMTAMRRPHAPTVGILLEAGASIDIVDAKGRSALQTAFEFSNWYPDVLQLFIRRVRAEAKTKADFVEKLVAAGCRLRHVTNDFELIKSLVDRGADVNSRDAREAMLRAACNGSLSTIRLLLKNGADPDGEVSSGGFTALHIIIASTVPHRTPESAVDSIERYIECAILLLQNGATFSISNELYEPKLQHLMLEINSKMRNIIIAHLAMIGTLDTPCTEWMERHTEYIKQRDLCQRLLKISFATNLSLLDLLIASELKMAKLVRNETFVAEMEKFCNQHNLSELCFYYYSTLMKNIDEASRRVKLEDKAALVLCKIFNGFYSQYYIAARTIIEYLGTNDLEQLCKV